ncbi:MAG: hypothetical protein FJX72_04800 [Armatimonadetes bacterium]|nr:hypothetical protein [Armatimonadota bacterium]
MTSATLSPQVQQRLAVFVPVVALAVSVFVVYPGFLRLRETQAEIANRRERLTNLRATPVPLLAAIQPAAKDTPSEPPEFLAGVRAMAADSRCELVGFDLTLPPAPVSGEKELAQGGNKPEEKKEAPSPVRPVRAKIEVRSDYDGIRSFIRAVTLAPRLYAIAGCEVKETSDLNAPPLQATVEIERYVLVPGALKDKPALDTQPPADAPPAGT